MSVGFTIGFAQNCWVGFRAFVAVNKRGGYPLLPGTLFKGSKGYPDRQLKGYLKSYYTTYPPLLFTPRKQNNQLLILQSLNLFNQRRVSF